MDAYEREEDHLREKISSKITVSTFLAGINFTVLTLVLTLLANKNTLTGNCLNFFKIKLSPHSLLEFPTALFFASTAFFVSTIYCYDRLLMPRNFWFSKYTTSRPRNIMFRIFDIMGLPPGNQVYT